MYAPGALLAMSGSTSTLKTKSKVSFSRSPILKLIARHVASRLDDPEAT